MSQLTLEDRLEIMEMVSQIAAEAAKNPNVTQIIELQTQLIEELYRTMVRLIEEDEDLYDEDDED